MSEASGAAPDVIRFSVFELNLRSGELRKAGTRINLQGQSLQTLALLLERPGDLVTRDELRQRLWPKGTFVDFEHGLNAVDQSAARHASATRPTRRGLSRRSRAAATGSLRPWTTG